MIKSELTDKGQSVEITGESLLIMGELSGIVKALSTNKLVLSTLFVDLADFYTKEEMLELVDRAYATKELAENIEDSPLKDILDNLIDKMMERRFETEDDGTTITD